MGILTDFGLPAMAIFSIDHDFSVWGGRGQSERLVVVKRADWMVFPSASHWRSKSVRG